MLETVTQHRAEDFRNFLLPEATQSAQVYASIGELKSAMKSLQQRRDLESVASFLSSLAEDKIKKGEKETAAALGLAALEAKVLQSPIAQDQPNAIYRERYASFLMEMRHTEN